MTHRRVFCSVRSYVWVIGSFLASQLLVSATVLGAPRKALAQGLAGGASAEHPDLGSPTCPLPSESGERLLNRQLGPLSLSNVTVADVVSALLEEHGVPLSFIEADPKARLTVAVQSSTVRQVLELIEARVPGYRHGFVGSRLVLFAGDSKWQTRVRDLNIARGIRWKVSQALAVELGRRFPELAELRTPLFAGNPGHFVYQDEVAVSGPGTVIELFTQVLGDRPAAVFLISARGWRQSHLWLDSVKLVRSVRLTAPGTTLRKRGEVAQLRVIGTLSDGRRKDLAPAGCGTLYSVLDRDVVSVSSDGLVMAVGPGEATVTVLNEDETDSLRFTVTVPAPSRLGAGP